MIDLKIDRSDDTNGGRTEDEVLRTIDFADWDFRPEENAPLRKALADAVRSEVAEAIRNTWKWDPPKIEFVSDGENIFVTMNIGSNWNDGHIWWIASIGDMIDDYLYCTNPDDMDGSDEARIELAKTLRASAAKLEAAVGKTIERKTAPTEGQPAWATEWTRQLIADFEETLRNTIEAGEKKEGES